jgi:Uma2 family endonuclease
MATTERITSADQLFDAPGPGRCELLRGELIMMSPTGSEHGYLVVNVTAPLATFVKKNSLGKVFGAETGFQIGLNPDTVRAPDVAFVRSERIGVKLGKGFFQGAPDLAVEVVSPSDRAGDLLAKVQDWLDAGCRAVWVVDPGTRTVSIHRGDQPAVTLGEADLLDGGEIVPGFSLPIAEVFGE